MESRETCPICDGEGRIESVHEAGDEQVCTACHGSGEVRCDPILAEIIRREPALREMFGGKAEVR